MEHMLRVPFISSPDYRDFGLLYPKCSQGSINKVYGIVQNDGLTQRRWTDEPSQPTKQIDKLFKDMVTVTG